MPCGDPGGGGQCHLLHVRDLSVKDLEAVIRKRKAEKKRAAATKKTKETEPERRARMIDGFMAKAARAIHGRQFARGQKVSVIFDEVDFEWPAEAYRWRWGEIQIKLRKWLQACRPLPTQMDFHFHLMGEHLPVLWSFHTHKR